jgi:hypothetical protein
VHNKKKPKKGSLPDDVTYIAGEDVPNVWNCYPWDAKAYGRDIYAHEELARQCVAQQGSGASPASASSHVPCPKRGEDALPRAGAAVSKRAKLASEAPETPL